VAFRIPFNKPFIVGKELHYIAQAVTLGNLGGDGPFTQKCCEMLEQRFEIPHVLLTPSCTAALELAVSLCDLGEGDEVIMPSFTFVSTANAVIRTGAKPVFVDIRPDTLNIDERLVETVIGPKTRAIIPVHYAGVGCEMDELTRIAKAHELLVVEDAAQAVNASYKTRALGSIAQLGTFSFHETKNYICGEGGALCVNDPTLLEAAHILRDKGTDRQKFLRGEVKKYQWVDVGSSYVPSELVSAFLYGQLEEMQHISDRRCHVFDYYFAQLEELEGRGLLRRPLVPEHCRTNYHLFYVVLPTEEKRDALERFLASHGVQAISHFEPLHSSPMGRKLGLNDQHLPVTESVAPRLLRLPLYYDISREEQAFVVDRVAECLFDAEKQAGADWPQSAENADNPFP
jgi:dTDP-4-amino-4,6-dideoxygalactose transaminase